MLTPACARLPLDYPVFSFVLGVRGTMESVDGGGFVGWQQLRVITLLVEKHFFLHAFMTNGAVGSSTVLVALVSPLSVVDAIRLLCTG